MCVAAANVIFLCAKHDLPSPPGRLGATQQRIHASLALINEAAHTRLRRLSELAQTCRSCPSCTGSLGKLAKLAEFAKLPKLPELPKLCCFRSRPASQRPNEPAKLARLVDGDPMPVLVDGLARPGWLPAPPGSQGGHTRQERQEKSE